MGTLYNVYTLNGYNERKERAPHGHGNALYVRKSGTRAHRWKNAGHGEHKPEDGAQKAADEHSLSAKEEEQKPKLVPSRGAPRVREEVVVLLCRSRELVVLGCAL